MTVPDPKYRRVKYQLQGLSWWQQIIMVWKNPPRLELLEDWIITLPGGLQVIVPKGFITDGASIPRLLWWIISPFGPLLEGAILHDFGYQHGYLLSPFIVTQVYCLRSMEMRFRHGGLFEHMIPVYVGHQQKFFDELLRFVTIEANGATVQAWTAYCALRIFGIVAWKNYRKHGPGAYNSNSLNLPGVPA
ncbi:MAG: DUF1353 domain-containing protein [Desulfocapsaceae bacterium]|nr:DUF1353 domain-containing protein [Desulfocapsaceae bacterium]